MSSDTRNEETPEEDQPLPRATPKRLNNTERTQQSDWGQQSRRKAPKLPEAHDCLAALGALPGLMLANLVTTSQANSMKGIYGTILQQLNRSQTGRKQGQVITPDLMQILRDSPELIDMIAPLLTDEQISILMKEAQDEQDGET